MKTKPIQQSEPAWQLIDAKDKVLGRLATEIANLLRGKNKPQFMPNVNCGDHVVVINAKDIKLTGNKLNAKTYYHYTGFPGGIKEEKAKDLIVSQPEKMITNAVSGMLPKNKLQPDWLKRLHVYPDNNHPHQANVSHLEVK
jgi:large subunit ribosomal protein L13